MRAWAWIVAAACCAFSPHARAAEPDAAPAAVRIPAWVEKGAAPPALADFRATVGGAPARVLGLKGPGDDLLLMLALDMTQELTQSTLAKDALTAEIRRLAPRTAVAVLRAQDALKVLSSPTVDRARTSEAVQSLTIGGKAGLLDTAEFLGRTGDAILRKSPVRVAILYVTDSDIQNYRENFTNPAVNASDTRDLSRKFSDVVVQERINKLATRLARQQTPLFIVHLVYRADTLNQAYQSGLQQLAETTAGASLFCRSGAEVADALRKTFEAIDNHYSLTVAWPPRGRKRAQVEIELHRAGAGRVAAHRTQLAPGR